jgi:hypothetical protein
MAGGSGVRPTTLSLSKLKTLAVLSHQLRDRQFKSFYHSYVLRLLRAEFPVIASCELVSPWLEDAMRGRHSTPGRAFLLNFGPDCTERGRCRVPQALEENILGRKI